MNATTYGLDVAKRVFQLYWVDAETGEIVKRRFTRGELIEFRHFAHDSLGGLNLRRAIESQPPHAQGGLRNH